MRLALISILAVALVGSFGFAMSNRLVLEDRDKLWKQVEKAQQDGLPKTVADLLGKIIESAKQDEDYDEAVKAWCLQLITNGQVEEGNPSIYIVEKMREEIDEQPEEMKPIARVILANWMFQYYQSNRWQFLNRTKTATPPGKDFKTWDSPTLVAECEKLFQVAIEDKQKLQETSIGNFDEILIKGNMPDHYRPTLYDFLAHQALAFYSMEEQFGRAQGAYDLPAGSPVFGDLKEFVQWKPESQDEDSRLLKAIGLYQELLGFHADDDDPSARLDLDLLRLKFGYAEAFGSEKTARYKAALQRFIDDNPEHETTARAMAALAGVIYSEGDYVAAHKVASQGLQRFPNTLGGNQCFNQVKSIEAREVQVSCERVWNEPASTLDIAYRNIDKLYFRLVKFDYEARISRENTYNPQYLDYNQNRAMARKPTVLEWSEDLPKTDDYKKRLERVAVKLDVPPGDYFLLASGNADFSEANNVMFGAMIWRSDLALVMRQESGNGKIEGMVTYAATGEPIANANVRLWARDNRNNRFISVPSTRTDANGIFSSASRQNSQHFVLVEHAGHRLSSHNPIYNNKYNRRINAWSRTKFFSDRAIYRPGQTIYFKGISYRSDQTNNRYSVIPDRSMKVQLVDMNGQIVDTVDVTTNEFGSFTGQFTAPRGSVTGQMRFQVTGGPNGNHGIAVEEYKRPKFYVEVEKPESEFQLDDDVEVPAKATAYTGAAIDGAQVRWKVTRNVQLPYWWYWRCWWYPRTDRSQEIANGTATTDVDGSFKIKFKAIPDKTVPRESEPVFSYTVVADVTDSAGETRSNSMMVKVGYTSLAASISVPTWQTTDSTVKVTVSTKTLDEVAQASIGTFKLFELKQPDEVQRKTLQNNRYAYSFIQPTSAEDAPADLSDFKTWPTGDAVKEQEVSIDGSGETTLEFELPVGAYKAVYETSDDAGQKVIAEYPFTVIDPNSNQLGLKIPDMFAAKKWQAQPGDEFTAVWGTGYKSGRAYVEVVHRQKTLQAFWTDGESTLTQIKQKVTENMRGGFIIRVTFVHENRAYLHTRKVAVPWSNKQLQVKWERFVSKLTPGGEETFTAVISGPQSKSAVAEFVATLYDASLDAFLPHNWNGSFNAFYQDRNNLSLSFHNNLLQLQGFIWNWRTESRNGVPTYRYFDPEITPNLGYRYRQYGNTRGFGGGGGGLAPAAEADGAMMDQLAPMEKSAAGRSGMIANTALASKENGDSGGPGVSVNPDVDLSAVTARKNLQETAFFLPHLVSEENGSVKVQFTIPEALTKWKFIGFAHDKQLRSAMLTDELTTSKDLMVQPNPPRFLREGDLLQFSVKVTNRSATRQTGKARLTFTNALNDQSMDSQLGLQSTEQPFEIPAGQSTSLFWEVKVPDFSGVLTYTAVAASERVSDGETGYLPVLSRKILVTNSLPLPINGKGSTTFNFDRLAKLANADSVDSQSLTVQMTSNPAWYAVMALPYLMEFPHECAEQTFNRMYANHLAKHIADSDVRIRRIFDQWRGTEALDSPLVKNEDLLMTAIEETPWLRTANKETKARQNVGILFEDTRMKNEIRQAMDKLVQMQNNDGRWPWFPGGRGNDYITLYIVTGFGRLQHLGVDVDTSAAYKALASLDNWLTRQYQYAQRHDPEKNHLTPTICLYLYGRSFFKDREVQAANKPAFDYYMGQAKKYWLQTGNRQSQGHLAIGLKRFGDLRTPKKIMASLKERSVVDEELGMMWREGEETWWWYRAPIESQALMIEAFDEVADDAESVELCKQWLLKQKQTQNWKTTKATADAVYALLMRGSQLLKSSALVQVSLGGNLIEPDKVEAGTGFYEKKFVRGEIEADMAKIDVAKSDEGIAWGSVHWQYLQDIGEVTAYEGTPLKLKKAIYRKINTDKGKTLVELDGPAKVGDELVMRVELRVDRAMEFVHLKDYRGSGTEPVDVLSRHKYQGNMAYYQSTRDTASHFFIENLPRGTFVFEYSVRVQHRGKYESGIASIQCMYAPEFNSHSESIELVVE